MADKKTSPKVATDASSLLRNKNTTKKTKEVAASDLGQAEGNKSKGKGKNKK